MPRSDTGRESSNIQGVSNYDKGGMVVGANQRQSWVGRKMSAMLDDSASRPLANLDEENGCHTIFEGRTTDAIWACSFNVKSKLPTVELPDDSPAHLSYAASRILHVRDGQEKAWKEREDRAENNSKSTRASTIATGCEDFNDETDTDTSTINSERRPGLAKKSSSRRTKNDRQDQKLASSQQRRQKRRSSAADARAPLPSKGDSKMDRSDPGQYFN